MDRELNPERLNIRALKSNKYYLWCYKVNYFKKLINLSWFNSPKLCFVMEESSYIHKNHNVTVISHLVMPAKYRRVIFNQELDDNLCKICEDIEVRYEIRFLEIGIDKDHVHFLLQSIPMYSPTKITQIIKSITSKKMFKKYQNLICLGMQLAAIEIARNLIGIKDVVTEEFKAAGTKIIERINKNDEDLGNSKITIENAKKTIRLGSYPCKLAADTIVAKSYGKLDIDERHRHRYKLNNDFQDIFEKNGVKSSGFSQDNNIVEVFELPDLQWFIGVQFHPEFKSKPFEAHPLFIRFVEAAIEYNKLRGYL